MGAHGQSKKENVPAGYNDERLRPRRRSNWTRYGALGGWRLVLLHASGSSPAGSRRSVAAVCFQRWLLTALMLMLVLVLVLVCLCLCDWGGCFCWLCSPRLSFDFFCLSLCAGTENPMAGSGFKKRNRRAAVRAKAQPRRAAPTGSQLCAKAWKHSVPASPASKLSQATAELVDGMSRECFVSPAQRLLLALAFCEASPLLGDKNIRAARALAVTG